MKKKLLGTAVSVLLAVSMLTNGIPVSADSATETDAANTTLISSNVTIRDNINISGIDVGGLTYSEAIAKVGGGVSGDTAVTLTSDYGDINTTLAELGVTDNTAEIVTEALDYGNYGNILKRYKDIETLKTTPVEYEIDKSVDSDLVFTRVNN